MSPIGEGPGTEGDEASLGQDEVLSLEQLSRDQRMNLNDSVFNLMLSQVGMNEGPTNSMDKLSEKADSDGGSESENNKGLPKNPALDEEGSPEAVTRKDTRLLHIVRVVSLCIIVILAVFVVVFVFRYTYHVEDETFETEFTELATTIIESFLAATRAKLLMTKSVAEYVSGLPGDSPMELSPYQFERVVRPQQVAVQAREVTWSPYLRTNRERHIFEKQHSNSSLTDDPTLPGLYPVCNFCDAEPSSAAFLNADDVVSLPGFGNSLTCGALEQAGRSGEIPSHDCDFLSAIATTTCQCGSVAVHTDNHHSVEGIFRITKGKVVSESLGPPFSPIGLASTTVQIQSGVMFNQLSDPSRGLAIGQMAAAKYPVLSETFNRTSDYFHLFVGEGEGQGVLLAYPLFRGEDVVGSITSEFGWRSFIPFNTLPPKSDALRVVIRNTCGQTLPFEIVDGSLQSLGDDVLLALDDSIVVSSTFADYTTLMRVSVGLEYGDVDDTDSGICQYKFEVYPTEALQNEFMSHRPGLYATFAATMSGIAIALFTFYDCFVRRRQKRLLKVAKKSTALIASLFPKMVRNQIIEDTEKRTTSATCAPPSEVATKVTRRGSMFSSMTSLDYGAPKPARRGSMFSSMASLNYDRGNASFAHPPSEESRPIATLFEHTTVMFLDLKGFTAWSSEREPNDVFLLLETIYQSFDEAAQRRGVFKIETIGDCYVAATGIPDQIEDHACVMARFAQECIRRMKKITRQLEPQLGPDTSDLECRIGIHSGSVTGGVLRGEKARFQLFGDTMNTAARMESTGLSGMIQASSYTADLIIQSGRQNWVVPRPDLVEAKGKGKLQTYWINPNPKRGASRKDYEQEETKSEMSSGNSNQVGEETAFAKDMRLIEWNVDLLFAQLQKLVAARGASGTRQRVQRVNSMNSSISRLTRGGQAQLLEEEAAFSRGGGKILEEFSEIIDMPKYDAKAARKLSLNDDMQVDFLVKEQLREYVTRIASMYRDNAFHNFEHASHVAMTTSKLLKRMLTNHAKQRRQTENSRDSHNLTYGISSDPLMQFTLVFAALIHDVDHTGLQNSELVQMRSPVAVIYKNKSIAEQNSLDVAWKVLMDEDFSQLRECIYSTKDELRRFRQLLVNAILATDLADTDAQERRNARWELAFQKEADDLDRRGSNHASKMRNDMKATILYEYTMQAADIAHCIQHFQTFNKFHEREFTERYTAFMIGDSAYDPSTTWYEDELAFFDNTVIPLADKLRVCGVFGSTGNEFMRWAEQNRSEWASKGRAMVRHMRENVAVQYEKMDARQRRRRGSIL